MRQTQLLTNGRQPQADSRLRNDFRLALIKGRDPRRHIQALPSHKEQHFLLLATMKTGRLLRQSEALSDWSAACFRAPLFSPVAALPAKKTPQCAMKWCQGRDTGDKKRHAAQTHGGGPHESLHLLQDRNPRRSSLSIKSIPSPAFAGSQHCEGVHICINRDLLEINYGLRLALEHR